MKNIQYSLLASLLVGTLSISCSKESETTATAAVAEEEEDEEAAVLAAVESVSELGVSTSLSIAIPEAFAPEAASLRLVNNDRRSRDACRMGSSIKEVTDQIANIASFFCHLEAEAEKIKFGTKYTIEFGGQEFGRVWADNSDAANGNITLYMCEDGALKEKIQITGIKKDADGNTIGVKGSVNQKGTHEQNTWQSAIVFDSKYTTEGLLEVSAEQKFSNSQYNDSFARAITLNLYDDGIGISTMALASSGSHQGNEFADRGYAMHDGDHGHALFESEGSYNDSVFNFTRHAYFDGDGYVVQRSSSEKFAADGDLYISASSMPEFLADDFEPDAPTGWDCETEETIELDPDSAAHQACESDHSEPANCWGEDFEDGENAE